MYKNLEGIWKDRVEYRILECRYLFGNCTIIYRSLKIDTGMEAYRRRFVKIAHADAGKGQLLYLHITHSSSRTSFMWLHFWSDTDQPHQFVKDSAAANSKGPRHPSLKCCVAR